MTVTEKFAVTGMSCASCSAHVEKAVRKVPGVTEVSVNLLTNSMLVEYDSPATEEIIAEAVDKAGYGACPLAGAGAGTQAGSGTDSGVDAADPENSSAAALAGQERAAESTAERAAEKAERAQLEDHETPKIRRRLIASVVLLLPLLYVSMGHLMWGWPVTWPLRDNPLAVGLYELLLCAMIMTVNQKFFISGFKGAVHGGANMDTLVAMGSGAGFLYSTAVLFQMTSAAAAGDMEQAHALLHGGLYFEASAMILTLITVGKMLEAYSKGRTTDTIRGLMDLSPKTAHVIRGGREITVPAESVRTGELFLVRPGESFPVDGVVTDGESAVNEAALTGESLPVDKTAGSAVSAATINQNGVLTCRATHVGTDTALHKIIEMVQNAAATKAPIARTADKVSGVFVPVVILIAAVDFAVWMIAGSSIGFALGRAISVLVISCPCALGLATPVAIMVGSGVGAKNGILFKTAASLEAAGKIRYAVLDKTGTITMGRPEVTDMIPAEGVSEQTLLAAAAALEAGSEHPLAKAVRLKAEAEGIRVSPVNAFRALPGHGVTGTTAGGEEAFGGNAALLREHGIDPGALAESGEKLSEQGRTPLYFAAGGKLLGIIAAADVVKEDSAEGIRELRALGIEPVMLTGDNAKTAQAIGRQLGLSEIIADVLPDGKEAAVRRLQQSGKTAMVGDGINDAPALTRADIGIAIGAGTDVAMDAADIVLMRSSLTDVAAAIRLSRQVIRNIRENLFWALFYNAVCIPIAAGALIPAFGIVLNPMIGAAAMSLSSVCVVTNALRLNLFKVHKENAVKQQKEKKKMEKEIKVNGMMCEHCVAHVKKALEAVDGVTSAEVSLEKKDAVVTLSKDVDSAALKKAVEDAGYEAEL
jgi:P-type Cu2+ transporter